jgi:hypothetical protein
VPLAQEGRAITLNPGLKPQIHTNGHRWMRFTRRVSITLDATSSASVSSCVHRWFYPPF